MSRRAWPVLALAAAVVLAVVTVWRAPGSAWYVVAPGRQHHLDHVRTTRT